MKRTLFIIFIALVALEAVVTLIAGYGGVFNPDYFHALPAMISMTFPLWALLTPIVAVVAIFINRKVALIPLVTMVVCIGPFLDFCPLSFFSKGSDKAPGFTLLTYNVFNFCDYHDMTMPVADNLTLRTILDSNADVVCLQESLGINVNEEIGITPELVDSIHARYPYRIHNSMNLEILSKYRMDTVAAPLMPSNTASMLIANVYINNTPVQIYNVHLQSIGLTRNDKELYIELTRGKADNHLKKAKADLLSKLRQAFKNRTAQADLIKKVIEEYKADNIIVCGDFNDIPGCYAMRQIESVGLKNAYTKAGLGPSCTYRADRFFFHIDQILYSKNLIPEEIHTLNSSGLSDHLPVFAEIGIKKEGE